MSRETTFQADVDKWQTIARTIAELTRQVVTDMKGASYQARTFTLKIRFSDFETLTRAKTLPHFTDSEEEIRRAIFECLKRVDLKKKVRLIGVRAGNLRRMAEAGRA
jgi:DNA polymerase-4